jgi:plasmid stabilization system protein ParE
MKVVFTSLALAELEEIRTFLIARSPRGAAKVEERIRQTVRMISEQPCGYQEVAERSGIRRAPLIAFPYVIYYRVGATQVEIIRIRHGARRPLEG